MNLNSIRCIYNWTPYCIYKFQVAMTAPTGIAASHISGQTLHSWAGIGLGKGKPTTIVAKVKNNAAACARWTRCHVLLIDEISMLDSELFSVLDHCGRQIRNSDVAFGGIQLIAVGDFFQLPPVELGKYGKDFAFASPSWYEAHMRSFVLKEVVRQQSDQEFVSLLNECRIGNDTTNIRLALDCCNIKVKPRYGDNILPTKLYSINRNVDEENLQRLQELQGLEYTFSAIDEYKGGAAGSGDRKAQTALSDMASKKIPMELKLKVGAQVVLLQNKPTLGLVNGSRGVVVRFEDVTVYKDGNAPYGVSPGLYSNSPVICFDNGITQVVKPFSVWQGGGANGAVTRLQVLPLYTLTLVA